MQFKFGYDGDSDQYGYYGADGSLIPFKCTPKYYDEFDSLWANYNSSGYLSKSFQVSKGSKYLVMVGGMYSSMSNCVTITGMDILDSHHNSNSSAHVANPNVYAFTNCILGTASSDSITISIQTWARATVILFEL